MHVENKGLGLVEYLTAGAGLLNAAGKAKSGGGASSAQPIAVTTSTSVNTQVSPQISPSFVQQSNPQDSAVTIGTGMNTPTTGNIPGFDYPANVPYSAGIQRAAINPAVIAGIGIVALGLLMLAKKKAK